MRRTSAFVGITKIAIARKIKTISAFSFIKGITYKIY